MEIIFDNYCANIPGFTRWNSANSAMEIYTGNEWVEVITDYFPNGSTIFNSY